jgi:hypothetical protein
MFGEGWPDREREHSDSYRDQPKLVIAAASATLDRSSDARRNIHQLDNEPESMDYKESRVALRTSPTP